MKEKSLCWNCKHGLCVRQSERSIIISGEASPEEPVNEWEKDISEQNAGPSELQSEGFVSICYWKPDSFIPSKDLTIYPIQFEMVHECSRFEKRNFSNKSLTDDKNAI